MPPSPVIEAALSEAQQRGFPLIMAILNATPDSFSDGGDLARQGPKAAVTAAVEAGADWLDLGAESTRPGAPEVPAEEQCRRLAPILPAALSSGLPVSVDTTSPAVARFALDAGVHCINDVSCLRDANLGREVARDGAWLILSHSRAPQVEMLGYSRWPEADYPAPVENVVADWRDARARAVEAGVSAEHLVFDPGLGFSKNSEQSLALLRGLSRFRDLGAPILVGASRKSFLGVSEAPPRERLGASLAAAVVAMQNGADILRVHDVKETVQALGFVRRVGPAWGSDKR